MDFGKKTFHWIGIKYLSAYRLKYVYMKSLLFFVIELALDINRIQLKHVNDAAGRKNR